MVNTIVNKTQRDIAEDHIHRKRKTYRQIILLRIAGNVLIVRMMKPENLLVLFYNGPTCHQAVHSNKAYF